MNEIRGSNPAQDHARTETKVQHMSPLAFAVISGIGLLISISLLMAFITFAPRLNQYGIGNNVFYVLLVPLGLSSAAFLFGTMNSWASYHSKELGGALQMGGPIVGAALTVVGGFFFTPEAIPLQLVVRPTLVSEPSRLIFDGTVQIDFGRIRRTQPLTSTGEATFLDIPAEFRGENFKILVSAPGFQQVDLDHPYDISIGAVYVEMRRTDGNSRYPNGLEAVFATSADFQGEIDDLIEKTKNEIYFVGLNFHISAADRFDLLVSSVMRGVHVRYIILDPQSQYLKEIAKGEDMGEDKLRQECLEGLDTLLYLSKKSNFYSNNGGSVEIRTLRWPPTYRAYSFDPGSPSGRTVLVPYLQGVKSPKAPAILINNDPGSAMFAPFYQSISALWNSATAYGA